MGSGSRRGKNKNRAVICETFDISGLTDEEKREADKIFKEVWESGWMPDLPELSPPPERRKRKYVVKANNRYKAVPQRDAVNEVMNAELRSDGSFDFDDMIKNHPNEFFDVLSITYYQITKNKSFVSPPEICVKAAAKYEKMFEQLEKPILHAIKRAIESGDHYNVLFLYKVKSFFMTRGVFTDIPDNLKEKAIVAAKIVHGDDYDTTALENNEAHLDTILGKDRHTIMYFSITKFEYRE